MNKIIVLIFLIVHSDVLFSQEPLVVFFADATTDSISVYRNDIDIECFIKIKEDSESENWHDVEILGQSNDKYKVRIIAINEDNAEPINGWVYKVHCGVWLHGRFHTPACSVVSLYNRPEDLYPFTHLKGKYVDDFGKYTNDMAIPILDYRFYNGIYWIKTEIVEDGKKISGWTRDYCPNIYGSCN